MRKKEYRNNNSKRIKLPGKRKMSRYEQISEDKISEYFRELASPDPDLEQDTFNWNQDRRIFD